MRRLRRIFGCCLVAGVAATPVTLLSAGCGGGEVTAAQVVVTVPAGLAVDQLRVEALVDEVPLVAGDVPGRAAGALPDGADLVLRFPDALARRSLRVLVASLAAGAQTGRGEGSGTLVRGRTILVPITLAAAPCPVDTHQCTGLCVDDTDVAHCGLACLTCPAPAAHGAAFCDAGLCAIDCDAGYSECAGDCVNLTTDPDHCGRCGRGCGLAEVCQDGGCIPNPCAAGRHLCGTECVTDTDVAHCGRACEPCPTPANGTATCDGTECGASCQSGYHACGVQCVSDTSPATCGTRCQPCPPPASGQGTPGCSNGACTVSCFGGYHACGGDCVDNDDVAHCGTRCEPCPAPAQYGSATCTAGVCGVACTSGYKPCQGACIPTSQTCQATWTLRSTPTAPSPRSRPAMAFDSQRDVVVLHGGWSGSQALDDLWEWDGTAWKERAPSLTPVARSAAAMAYDPVRQETLLFGGEGASGEVLGDTWTWDGTGWTGHASSEGPPARSFAGAVWNASFDEVWLFGGWGGDQALADVWAWDGTAWSEQQPADGPPAGRANFGLAFDTARGGGQLVVFGGGVDQYPTGYLGDTWLLGDAWSEPSLYSAPAARAGMGFAFDPGRGIGVLFGGYSGSSSYLGDTWLWNGAWAQLQPSGAPPARWRHNLVFDSTRGVMVLFGGASPWVAGNYYNDLWELSW